MSGITMFVFIRVVLLLILFAFDVNATLKEETISSIVSLRKFVNKAIERGVIPKQLPMKNTLFNAKFEDIEFNFRILIQWQLDSQCYAHHDFMIDATKGKNHSIKCNSGATIVITGDGDDWIDEGSDNDIIYAGKGNDTIDAGGGSDILVFEKGWGHDNVKLNGFEVIPSTIIGDDGTYHWKYSSFIVFGRGIKPSELMWKGDILVDTKTGDSIEFTHKEKHFNIVFIDYPEKNISVDKTQKLKMIQNARSIVLSEQKVDSLSAKGDILYLNHGTDGIDIVDVKDKEYPYLLSHVNIPGRALLSRIYENILYVAQSDTDMEDKKGWITMVDISNPYQPKILSTLKFGRRVYDFIVDKHKLILDESNRMDDESVFHIYDLQNLEKPRELASVSLKTHVQSIILQNNWLWAACLHGCGVYGYNMNNLKKLRNDGYFTIQKEWVFQMLYNGKVMAVLVSPDKPVIAFFVDPNDLKKGIASALEKAELLQENNVMALQNDYLVVAEGSNGVFIYDVSDVKKPVLRKQLVFKGHYIHNFAISGMTVYAVDESGGIHIGYFDGFVKDADMRNKKNTLSQDQLLTLLNEAVEEDDEQKVNQLIDRGALFKSKGHEKKSPIEHAAGLGNNKVLKALLDRGADPNFNHGQAIILAALFEKDGALRLLSQYGGDMKIKDKNDECTALHYIAQDGEVETAKFLISKGADPYAICRGKETPLTWATFGKNQLMIDFLKNLRN